MSIINFNNTQGLIPGTGSGKIYITTGAASSEALYGPWTEEALDNWRWLNNFTSQERLSLVGATIGIIHTTDGNTTVTEYQLCLDSTLQEHNGLYWKLKQSNISKSDQFTNDELLTIKDGYTNSGYGLFKTISLPDNINEADLIPVQYCPADITIFSQNDATSPIAQRVLKSNYLYVLKSNILNVLLYKAGDGINIVNSAINIKHSKSDTGKYLKATNSGVQWVNLPNQDNPYVSSQSIAYDSDSKELSVRIGNSTAECGLMITSKGLSIFKPETSGYLYYDISKGFCWQNSGASSSSYTSTLPIYISGKDIQLNYTDPFTVKNNSLALNIGDGLTTSEHKLKLKPASHDELGGINASVVEVEKELLLATHELSDFNSYKEYDIQKSKDGEEYNQSRGNSGFIGAECVIVKQENDTLNQNKLYADLSNMIQIATPEGDYLRVYIAAEDGKGISKGQLFVKQPVVVVEDSDDSLQLYLYSLYTTEDAAPDFLSQVDALDYNICTQVARLQPNLVLVDMDETHSGIYKDVTAIIINTIAQSTTEKARTIIVNVKSLYGCELTTYGNAVIRCPDAELDQRARTIKIPTGTYAISCTHGTGGDKLVITVEKYQKFSDIV